MNKRLISFVIITKLLINLSIQATSAYNNANNNHNYSFFFDFNIFINVFLFSAAPFVSDIYYPTFVHLSYDRDTSNVLLIIRVNYSSIILDRCFYKEKHP